jgi:aspartate carbamoyltransferase regulatory subunit
MEINLDMSAEGITKQNIIAIARLAKISPAQFVNAITDFEAQQKYALAIADILGGKVEECLRRILKNSAGSAKRGSAKKPARKSKAK